MLYRFEKFVKYLIFRLMSLMTKCSGQKLKFLSSTFVIANGIYGLRASYFMETFAMIKHLKLRQNLILEK